MKNFYSEIIVNDNRFHSQHRISDIDLLEPGTRKCILNIIAEARFAGVELMVFETYRSEARQKLLFEQGATQLKSVGVHHFGLACDLVKNNFGRPSWEGDFSLLGKLANKYGLIWGGDWGKPDVLNQFIDAAHVQRCSIPRQSSLFSFEWYPNRDYNPYFDF